MRRAEVDAHVEDGEARVAPRAGWPSYSAPTTDDTLGFSSPMPSTMTKSPSRTPRRRRNRQDEVAGRDEQAAEENRLALADQPVGDPAARNGEQVGAAGEQRVHRAGGRAVDAEAGIRPRSPRPTRNSTSIERMP